jgi:hypothetical protein
MGRPPLGERPMSATERSRRHRAMQEAMDAGRAARIDRINDETRLALSGLTPARRSEMLQAKAGTWSRFLFTESGGGNVVDHATRKLLGLAFARMEILTEDIVRREISALLKQMEKW